MISLADAKSLVHRAFDSAIRPWRNLLARHMIRNGLTGRPGRASVPVHSARDLP